MQQQEKYIVKTTKERGGDSDGGEIGSNSDILLATPTKQNYTMKMDLRLIPILGCTYTILFLDRTNSELSIYRITNMR